ncbi:type II toxin-antitoxin system VapC family toxin [Candidatus Bathyarchaeota archaeon A05DMB-2]|jgi:predicted nucleic acid-binding protein|nr:type II toxin-antitoxin system VapC family toxin [Candidatus Bathyarchaeota archaeon A05DMB-2]
MPKAVYDTRFFIEYFYSQDAAVLRKAKEVIQKAGQGFISAIVIHEVYQLVLKKEGRETAILRTTILEKDFKIVDVNSEIAKSSAELRNKHKMSLADSIIAATAMSIKATCLTDDPHFKAVSEIKTAWI